jgi:hypothetical protein
MVSVSFRVLVVLSLCYFLSVGLFANHFNGAFYLIMASNGDGMSSDEEQEKLIKNVLDVTSIIRWVVASITIFL